MHERRTLSIEDAALVLGLSRSSTFRAIRRGEIASIKIGRRRLVLRDSIEKLLAPGNCSEAGDDAAGC